MSERSVTTEQKNDEIFLREIITKFRELIHYLLSKWVVLSIAGIIGSGLGILYAVSKKPVYTAELSFALDDAQSSSAGLGAYVGLASQFGLDLGGSGGGGAFSGENLLEFMKSRSMVQRALLTPIDREGKKQTLAEFYIEINNFRKRWAKNGKLQSMHFLPNEDPATFTREKDSILIGFYTNIVKNCLAVIKKDKKLGIVTVSVKTENESFSKHFTETLVKVVSDFYIDTKTKKSAQNLAILKHQVDSVRRALNFAIMGVATSVDVNPNPNPARQFLRVPSQNRQVDVQANSAILQELVKNYEVAKITLRKETPFIQIIDRPILPLQKEKTSKVKTALIGAILMCFFVVLFLLLKRFWITAIKS